MSSLKTRKAVVCFTPEVYKHKERGTFAARVGPLGLTGYGGTVESAYESMEGLYRSFVEHYRKVDLLEDVLNRSGIEWYWEDEYMGKLPVKDVSSPGGAKAFVRQPQLPSSALPVSSYEPVNCGLAA